MPFSSSDRFLCYFAANWSENDACPLEKGTLKACKSIFTCWMWLFIQNSRKIRNCGIFPTKTSFLLKSDWILPWSELCENDTTVKGTIRGERRRRSCWEVRGQGVLYPHCAFQMEIPPRGCRPWRRTGEREREKVSQLITKNKEDRVKEKPDEVKNHP